MLVNKFSKIAKRWGRWPEVTWFDQIVFFQADCDKIKLQKISYVILVT